MNFNTSSTYDLICICIPGYILFTVCAGLLQSYSVDIVNLLEQDSVVVGFISYLVGLIFKTCVDRLSRNLYRSELQLYTALKNTAGHNNSPTRKDSYGVLVFFKLLFTSRKNTDFNKSILNIYDVAYMRAIKDNGNTIKVLECQTRLLVVTIWAFLFLTILIIIFPLYIDNCIAVFGMCILSFLITCCVWHRTQIKQYSVVFDYALWSFESEKERLTFRKMFNCVLRQWDLSLGYI